MAEPPITPDAIADALVKSVQKKLWVAVILGLLAAGSSILNFIDPNVRAEAYTSKDAKIDRAEIVDECHDYVDNFLRPPTATRIRIEALENALIDTLDNYLPPTDEWQ